MGEVARRGLLFLVTRIGVAWGLRAARISRFMGFQVHSGTGGGVEIGCVVIFPDFEFSCFMLVGVRNCGFFQVLRYA